MSKFVFTYHGGSGMAATPQEQEQQMAAWGAWMGGLGDKLTDGGAPFGQHKTLTVDGSVEDGGPAATLGGYSIVEASSIDDAVAMAKGCPVLEGGGTVQVSEALEM